MYTWLDRLNLLRQRPVMAWCAARRWRNLEVRRDAPRIYYGYDELDISGGGLVKLNDLLADFPNDPQNPNVFYLVSSALPIHADLLVSQAKHRGVRVVVNQNGVAYPAWHGAGWRWTNAAMRRVLRLADHVVYQSEFCRRAADHFLGPVAVSSEILYNPVDTRAFSPTEGFDRSRPLRLILAGTHQHFYRPQAAVDAVALLAKNLPEIRLVVAGRCRWRRDEREAEAELAAYIREKKLQSFVEWAGPYAPADAPRLLRQATILIHTKYNDPCPRLVVEAMACGLPIVYSASGGVPELVGAEAGIGIPAPLDWNRDHPPGAEAVATAVRRIHGEHARYAQAARRRAESKFGVQPWLDRHRAIFQGFMSVGDA